MVNAPFLLSSSDGFTPDAVASGPDRVAAFAVVAFAQAKFYLLFSFLFGYSLVLLLRGAGDDGGRRYRRRLIGLAVLGVAAVTGVAVTVWLLLDVLARWWGRRYRYGPAEWVLRGWTLGRTVPLGYPASGAEGLPRDRL